VKNKVKNKAFYIVLILLFIAVVLSAAVGVADRSSAVFAAFSEDNSVYSADNSVYEINSEEEFYSFYDFAVKSKYDFNGKIIRLFTDADCAFLDIKSGGSLAPFCGTFDGFGHTLKNINGLLFSEISAGATVRNLDLYSVSTTGAGVANLNYGTIENVSVSGEIYCVQNGASGGIVSFNGGTGLIRNCVNSCVHRSNGIGNSFSGIASVNNGTIERSVFVGTLITDFTEGTNVNTLSGITCSNGSSGKILNCTVAAEYRSEGTATMTVRQYYYALAKGNADGTVSGTAALIDSSIVGSSVSLGDGVLKDVTAAIKISGQSERYYRYENDGTETAVAAFPDFGTFTENLFEGEGTAADPFAVTDFTDLNLMKISAVFGEYTYKLNGDIDLTDRSTVARFGNFNINGGSLVGGGFALLHGKTPAFSAELGFTGQKVWFIDCVSTSLTGNGTTDGYADLDYFNYIDTSGTNAVSPSGTLSGEGTELSPYYIYGASDLAALNGKSGYAILVNDIALDYNGAESLIPDLKANINGNGKTVTGIIGKPLFTTVSGKVYNVKIRSYGVHGVCETVAIGGSVDGVKVYGKGISHGGIANENYGVISNCEVGGAFKSAFVLSKNDGEIKNCVNFAQVDGVFSVSGTGKITNSVNHGVNAETAVSIQSYNCLDINNRYVYLSAGTKQNTDFNYLELKDGGFDFTEFGYEKGNNLPSLRKFNRVYKTVPTVLDKNFTLPHAEFSEEISYTQQELNEAVTEINGGFYSLTEYIWTRNGAPLIGDIHNAGVYTVTAVFAGNDDYLPTKEELSFTISKINSSVSPQFTDFTDYTVVYDGNKVTLTEPQPDNYDVLQNMGFTAEYELTLGGELVSAALECGDYLYTVRFVSQNYNDLLYSVNLTVDKKELFLKVADGEVVYGNDFDPKACSVSVTDGLTERDKDCNVSDLVSNYYGGFSTDYVKGSPVGTYELNFVGEAKNYRLTVTGGKLTAVKAPFPTEIAEKIEFYGAKADKKGTHTEVFNGNPVVLSADYPDGVTVAYENNANTEFGNYEVSAVFTIDGNYENLVLKVDLTIDKADLTVSAPNITVAYGAIVDKTKFSVEVVGLCGSDTAESLFGGEFTFALLDGATEITGVYDAGTYSVKVAEKAVSLRNYRVNYVDGDFNIEKASLKFSDIAESIGFTSGEKEYDGKAVTMEIKFLPEFAAVVSAEYEIKKDGDTVTEIRNAGNYVVNATVVPSGNLGKNYKTTVFTCEYKITKKTYALAFSQSEYGFVYDGSSKNELSNFAYTGLPDGAAVTLKSYLNGAEKEIKRAGRYTVTIIFNGTENESPCSAEAVVVVDQKVISAEITGEYVYGGSAIIPTITALNGVLNGEVTLNDFRFSYRNSLGTAIPNIVNAGSYYVDAAVTNSDYRLARTEYSVTVKKITVPFTLGEIGFVYGFSGELTAGDRRIEVNGGVLTYYGYVYGGNSFDVSVNVGVNAGTYNLKEQDVVDLTNYDFVLEGVNSVTIAKRELTVEWLVDGIEINAATYKTEYTGKVQDIRFGYRIKNLAFDETQSSLDLKKSVSGESDTVYNAGVYYIKLALFDSNNYVLTNARLEAEVTKAKLKFSVADAEVWRWESCSLSYSFSGAVGDDVGKTAATLKGARIVFLHSYNPEAPVGSAFTVGLDASFYNYEAEIIRIGTLTVTENPYPNYLETPYWRDITTVYTGQNYVMEIQNVPEEVTVIYSGNVQKDAGIYTVGATVTYPTGRQNSATRKLTITAANPTVTPDYTEMLYKENYLLTKDNLTGKAEYLGQTVEGEIIPDGEQVLQSGTHLYDVVFMPLDSKNFNSVKVKAEIKSASVTFADFTIDNPSAVNIDTDGTFRITAKVTMSLNKPLTDLILYRNGSPVEQIGFNATEKVTVRVALGDETAYENVFNVVFDDKVTEITVDEKVFFTDGVSISGRTISVDEGGGRLSIDEKYRSEFSLYINGNYYEEFIFNGREGEVTLTVKTKGVGVTVYGGIFTVKVAEKPAQIKQSYTLYYIIGGSVLGVAVIVAVVLIVWKKIHG